jgi:hypothetical protein
LFGHDSDDDSDDGMEEEFNRIIQPPSPTKKTKEGETEGEGEQSLVDRVIHTPHKTPKGAMPTLSSAHFNVLLRPQF